MKNAQHNTLMLQFRVVALMAMGDEQCGSVMSGMSDEEVAKVSHSGAVPSPGESCTVGSATMPARRWPADCLP